MFQGLGEGGLGNIENSVQRLPRLEESREKGKPHLAPEVGKFGIMYLVI